MAQWRSPSHQYLSPGETGSLDSAGRFDAAQSSGTDAIRKAFAADGTTGSLVRLDRHRFSSGATARGYQPLVPLSRWNSSGHAAGGNPGKTTSAWPSSTRSEEGSGRGGKRFY